MLESAKLFALLLCFFTAQATAFARVYPVELRVGFDGVPIHYPIGVERAPVVIVLHGSEGGANGNARYRALWLAQHGFVTIALPYSKGGNQWHAGDIVDVALDRTEQAIIWARAQAFANGRVGLVGYSRGAEHALLVASFMARDNPKHAPDAVAVHAPTDVVVRDFHSEGILPDRPTSFPQARHAWTWRGSTAGLDVGSAIEIERYEGSLYISHGENDNVWSVQRTQNLEKRLLAAKRTPQIRYLASEGHGLSGTGQNRQTQEWVEFFRNTLR